MVRHFSPDADDSSESVSPPGAAASENTGPPGAPVIRSKELLRGSREILIEHDGSIYRLRETRNGKLILHK